MTLSEDYFAIWAPTQSPWSAWAAPVFFAQLPSLQPEVPTEGEALPPTNWLGFGADSRAAFVIDLPGSASILLGMALARRGWRPVPAFNASPGPTVHPDLLVTSPSSLPSSSSIVAIDMRPLVRTVVSHSGDLRALDLPPNASPAFLLDSMRLQGHHPIDEGMFDNRWMVFPQDFPSAAFLRRHGIARVVLIQEGDLQPQEDLAHVLLRWQEAGIEVQAKRLSDDSSPSPIKVVRPPRFRAFWYRALALLGLRRNSAGGFGSIVPSSSSSS